VSPPLEAAAAAMMGPRGKPPSARQLPGADLRAQALLSGAEAAEATRRGRAPRRRSWLLEARLAAPLVAGALSAAAPEEEASTASIPGNAF